MMGCGKSAVGERLAAQLAIPFFDVDKEIEKQQEQTIPELFEHHGEAYFRILEREMTSNLMEHGPCIIATGGGAFMNEQTRELILNMAITVWIYGDFEVLYERVSRKDNRPLLESGDKAAILKELMAKRYPVYELAPVKVTTSTGPHEETVQRIINAIEEYAS